MFMFMRKHFDKAGMQRHNAAWEARLSQQKRVVARKAKRRLECLHFEF